MENIINFDGVSYAKEGKIILNNLTFDIEKGSIVNIVGASGSGKSTLINILAGITSYNGYIAINGYYLNRRNMKDIRSCASVLLDDINNLSVGEFVSDELSIGLNNLGEDELKISKKVIDIAKKFKIDKLLNNGVFNISNSERVKMFLASALITNPSVLIMDNCLHQLSVSDKKLVLDILKDYNKNKKLTIIMVTNDMEDTYISDRIIVLSKGNIVMDGTPLNVFKQKDKLLSYGVNIPFVIDLSLKLMDKEIVNHVYVDMRKLVDDLWK